MGNALKVILGVPSFVFRVSVILNLSDKCSGTKSGVSDHQTQATNLWGAGVGGKFHLAEN